VSAPERLGVGILGAGPVTQAIHLPTLARLADRFRVAVVMDVDAALAERVASRAGARSTTDQDALLADPEVDVVLICSPPQFHASQVEAACAAGVRAVLCEKPFATSQEEAERIARAAADGDVPLVVGAMHAFDPGWLAAKAAWDETVGTGGGAEPVVAVRSSIVLPPNPRFEDRATQVVARPSHPSPDLDDPRVVAALARNLVLGLTVHDLPLVRSLVPRLDAVVHAAWLPPFGAHLSVEAPGTAVELLAVMHQQWRPEWTLQAWTQSHALEVAFTPSYVHAGSATAAVRAAGRTHVFGPFEDNGYVGEWHHLYEVATGRAELCYDAASVVADLTYTLAVADGAAGAVLAAASPTGRAA